jgi:Squalene-hopene cyclase C-terminal domain
MLLAWIPSWGTSLLLHGLAILLLAIYVYVHSGGQRASTFQGTLSNQQLTEDLTSLYDSDHAGDPFTNLKSPEPPSLSVEAPETKIDVISQPEIPQIARFMPDLAGPEGPPELGPSLGTVVDPGPSSSTKGAKVASYRLHAEDITAPFSGRGGVSKAKLLRREGGTVHSEKAVENGVDWIIRHQRPDGSWSLSYQTQCQGTGCSGQPSLESDTAATGLALLPLLGAGHIHTQKSRYQLNVRKGLEWLVDHQDASGDLFVGGAPMAYLYSHAIATMALCEAYGISGDPTLRRPAERALRFIVQAQSPETGGWRYNPGQPGDTSVFGWNIFALRSARLAGIAVPKNVLRGCKTYLDSVASDSSKVLYAYMPGRPVTSVMTAEALLSRQYMGWPREYPPLVKGARHIAVDLEQSEERNIYYWYYATQLLHNMQNQDWKRWNTRVREGLITMQVKGDGCDRGSWDPLFPQPDRWARSGGRLFLTALSMLTLEVYYRYLPLYQPSDTDPLHGKEEGAAAEPRQAANPPQGTLRPLPAQPEQ